MNIDRLFFNLTIILCAAAYIANGGWSGKRFGRLRNLDAADRLLFLTWAMLLCGFAAMVNKTQ